DDLVTGVQTCALPICSASEKTRRASHGASPAMAVGSPAAGGAPELAGAPRLRSHGNVRRPSTICGSVPAKAPAALRGGMTDATRSEERRVGEGGGRPG